MIETLKQPWPWYVAGAFAGLIVPALLLLGNKHFGISSSLRHICAACMPAKIPFFQYDWKKETWNLFFVVGILLGGAIGAFVLNNGEPVQIAAQTVTELKTLNVELGNELMPASLFSIENLFTIKGLVFFVIGGFMVGFGTRYAGGCTSGHTIMGLATLQWPSLVASCCFMLGGFITTHLIFPWLFKLL